MWSLGGGTKATGYEGAHVPGLPDTDSHEPRLLNRRACAREKKRNVMVGGRRMREAAAGVDAG